MERYVCIHGHFYQPPRENPWLEAIELQDSAAPYHDWNERITAECYAPNSVSRILDEQNRIRKLVNNYAKMSFNFGPTLLSWLERRAPEVYQRILQADRESRKRFSGHGSALAQTYNHLIMPLANRRDRITQIRWGIADFERRFRRAPEGMWVAETAVDVETLELLAEAGIRFTLLAPHQAARVRRLGAREWIELNGEAIEPTRAYLQRLPSGRTISLFFYHGAIAREVAFGGLLSHGDRFLDRLAGAFSAGGDGPQLAHIATDGETYGHHHRFGDMALAYVLDQLEARGLARLTNYGEFLEKNPPTHEVEIVNKSSWSCSHGIDRWWSDCGCNTGAHPGWNQAWRTPLRNALDWLRDTLAPRWEKQSRELLKDPWAARDAYIEVIDDRSAKSLEAFFARQAVKDLTLPEKTRALELLELQRHALLMYTSCGWFFDDLAGIETVQNLQFAGRTIQLAEKLFGEPLEPQFAARLAEAKSNRPEQGDGSEIYERAMGSSRVDWHKLAAHCAVSSLFEDFAEPTSIYCYEVALERRQRFSAGKATLGAGQMRLQSKITLESQPFCFGALHLGDHHITAGVAQLSGQDLYQQFLDGAVEPFMGADFTAVIRAMGRCFGESAYSARSLFRDEQRRILEKILASNLQEAEALYRQIYEPRAPLLRFLTDLGMPLPRGFSAAAEFVINHDLRIALERIGADPSRAVELLETAKREGLALDTATLEFAYRRSLEALSAKFLAAADLPALEKLHQVAGLLPRLPFSVNLWRIQNEYYQRLETTYPGKRRLAGDGDQAARSWITKFEDLGRLLGVRVL
jgi:alpha-amylase/alpha-mannosidase (GH57 family)